MYTLNVKQTLALNMLAAGFSQLSDAWDDELGKILSDLGVLPGRDLTEAAHELFHCLEKGAIGTREELLRHEDSAAKIGLLSITVSTDDSALFTSFAAASKHIQQLAETYDHCKVLLQWEDLSTHEVEYDLCRDPFQYDLTKRVKYYLEHAIKADANVINAFEIDVAAIQKLIEGYQLEDQIYN